MVVERLESNLSHAFDITMHQWLLFVLPSFVICLCVCVLGVRLWLPPSCIWRLVHDVFPLVCFYSGTKAISDVFTVDKKFILPMFYGGTTNWFDIVPMRTRLLNQEFLDKECVFGIPSRTFAFFLPWIV